MVKFGSFGNFGSNMNWISGSRMSYRSGIPLQSFLGFLHTYISVGKKEYLKSRWLKGFLIAISVVKMGNFCPFDSKMEWFSGSRMSCRTGIPVQSFLGFLPTYISVGKQKHLVIICLG